MKKIIFLLPLIFVLNSCVSSKKIAEVSVTTEKIAKNNFVSDYKIIYNKNYNFAAIYKSLTKDINGNLPVKVMLYDTKNNKIIWGRKAINAKLEWISKNKLQVKYLTRDKKHKTLVYDTKTGKVSYI
jgi:hypothetical protein